MLVFAKDATCVCHRSDVSLAKAEYVQSAMIGTKTSTKPCICDVVNAALDVSLMILIKVMNQMMMINDADPVSLTRDVHRSSWLVVMFVVIKFV